MIVDPALAHAAGTRPVGDESVMVSVSLPPLSIGIGIARRLQLPSKLMAQRKFGTRRRAMLSFERQPFPAPCHVDQDVAHSRAWCALGHLTTFDRVLSALYRRNHLPTPPCTQPMLPRASLCGQRRFTPGVHFGGNSNLCATSSCARFGSALYGGLGSHHPFGSCPPAPPASRPAWLGGV